MVRRSCCEIVGEARRMNGRVAARRAQAVAYLGGKCVRCETTLELQFVHRSDAAKRFDIAGRDLLRPAAEVVAELAKCYLLCPRHRKEKMRWTHGTEYAWLKMKCRCVVCEPAWREWKEQRSVKRGADVRGRYQRGVSPCGTRRAYLKGCRCGECRGANAEYTRERRTARSSM